MLSPGSTELATKLRPLCDLRNDNRREVAEDMARLYKGHNKVADQN